MIDVNIILQDASRKDCSSEWMLREETVDYYNLFFVLEGKAIFWINDNEYRVHKNQAVLIPAGSRCKAISQSMAMQSFKFVIDGPSFDIKKYVVDIDSPEYIKRLFTDFNHQWLLKEKYYYLKCKAIFYHVLYIYLNQSDDHASNYHVKQMMQYIQENYLNRITIDDLSQLTGLNSIYCGALFRK